eukprot:3752472-Rhodomonas_salina.1
MGWDGRRRRQGERDRRAPSSPVACRVRFALTSISPRHRCSPDRTRCASAPEDVTACCSSETATATPHLTARTPSGGPPPSPPRPAVPSTLSLSRTNSAGVCRWRNSAAHRSTRAGPSLIMPG